MLTEPERRELLERARCAGARALGLPARSFEAPEGLLAQPGASFVTWKREGRLRGCIGMTEPVRPLAEDVEQNAVAALLHDPRFAPATARDFPQLTVDISVLFPRERITGPADIVIGEHGLYVERGQRRGLLLPQVAPEWGWDVERFLEQVCLKAGLPGDSWRGPGAAVYRFAAEVFGETEGAPGPSA
jgi:AmmeMemoRadiSam system protein A